MRYEIINFVHEYYKINNTTPRLKDFVKKNGYPCNKDTVIKIFGTFNNLIKECGYETYEYGQRHYNKKELLNELKKAILQHRSIDFRYIRKNNNLKHRDVYTRVFGSVRNAIKELSITNNQIYLLKTYKDYMLEDPQKYLKSKINFIDTFESNELIIKINQLKHEGISLLRDSVCNYISIYKIYKIFGSYNNFMIISGNEVNLKNKNYTLSNDGHMCDSYEEKIIDDLLYELNIYHDVHVKYPNSNLICDFKLSDCYIECAGYKRNTTSKGHDKYVKTLNNKIKICSELNVKLIIIENANKIDRNCFAEALASDCHRITM